jgi:prevent-host-death family protein
VTGQHARQGVQLSEPHVLKGIRMARREPAKIRYFSDFANMQIFRIEEDVPMPATLTRSAFEAQVGEALDKAMSQPVIVTKHGKPKNVVLSYDEYERLAARDRRIVTLTDWTETEIQVLESMEMEPGLAHLDAELEA